MHHFYYRLEEGPCFPSAQTTFTTWIMYRSNFNFFFFFKKTNYWKPPFFFFYFVFYFLSLLHIIQSLMKSRLLVGWQRNTHCWVITTIILHHLKKKPVQLSRHQVSYIKDGRPLLILMLCKYQTSFTCQRKKSFKLISCRLHSPGFLHSWFS